MPHETYDRLLAVEGSVRDQFRAEARAEATLADTAGSLLLMVLLTVDERSHREFLSVSDCTLIRPSDAHGLGPGDRLAPRLALTVEIGKRVAADVFKSGQRAA